MKKLRYSLLFILLPFFLASQPIETVIQGGHLSVIKTTAFTPDGNYLLTGSRDKTIKLWDVSSGRELRTFFGHTHTVNDLAVAADGRTFVSSSADGSAIRWQIDNGKILNRYSISDEYLTSISISSNGKYLITSGFELKAYLWDIKSGDTLRSFQVIPDKGVGYGVNTSFSEDNETVYFGNDNRTITAYTISDGKKQFEYAPPEGWCGGCATFIEAKQNLLISASNGSTLSTHNLKTGAIETIYNNNLEDSRALDLSKDLKFALHLTDDSLHVYNLSSGKRTFSILTEDKVNEAIFSPDGNSIVTVNDDKEINFYNSLTGELIRTIGGYKILQDKGGLDYDANSRWDFYIKKYTDLRNSFDISPDNTQLAKAKIGSSVRIWDIKSGKILTELRGHEKAVLTVKYSHSGKFIATGGADGHVKIWDTHSGNLITTLKGHREVVFDLSFSEDDSQLISGSWDGTAIVWDLKAYTLSEVHRFSEGSPYQLNFYRNDIYTIISGLDKTLSLYELDSKKNVRSFVGHTDIIHGFDQSNETLVSVSWDGSIKAWNILTGLQSWRNKSEHPQYAIAIDKANQLVASSGASRVIDVQNLSDGKLQFSLKGHQSSVTDLKFANNGQWLLSSSEDGMIKIWDLETKQEIVSYIAFDNNEWVAINNEGYFSGSLNAFNKIAFVQGMESYSVDQFFNTYYQPDLLNKAFGKSTTKESLEKQLKKFPPPKIGFIAPHPNETVKFNQIEVIIKVEDQGGGAETLKFFQNGKHIETRSIDLKNGKGAVDVGIELIAGTNVLEASAINSKGFESNRISVNVQKEGKKNSSLYIFAIGINHYENEALNLNYARADAEGFIDVIKSNTKNLFEKVEVIPLYDKEATKDNILNQLKILEKRITPEDVLFFYYAGHGSIVEDNFYFIPTDNVKLYSEDRLKEKGISAGQLQAELQKISALKQLLIIDACQSGGSVELLAQRGAPEEKALAQLSRSTGIHVLSAAGSEQFATEFEELGHGLFTYVLLEALSGKADGAPKDGKVTIYELKSYLDDQVPEFSKQHKGKMQFPHTFSKGQDFPVIIN